MVPPPDYASIDEALQLGIIDKLGPPPTAKVNPSQKEEGTPLYFMHKLLDDERLTEDQRKELLAEGRTGPYTGASLYDRHLSLRPHLQQFYERGEFLHYYNQVRSTWRNKYYPQAAAGTAGHQGGNGNNWNGNSGQIVPTNQGFNHQVGQGWGGVCSYSQPRVQSASCSWPRMGWQRWRKHDQHQLTPSPVSSLQQHDGANGTFSTSPSPSPLLQ